MLGSNRTANRADQARNCLQMNAITEGDGNSVDNLVLNMHVSVDMLSFRPFRRAGFYPISSPGAHRGAFRLRPGRPGMR
jgi:hypothetical protein